MNPNARSAPFDARRSAAIEQLLIDAATDGTPENRHFHNTRGTTALLSAVAGALVVTGGAITLMEQPVSDKSSIVCFARADYDGGQYPGPDVISGIPSTAERPDSRVMIDDPVSVCRDVWAQNGVRLGYPEGSSPPEDHDPTFSSPVPAQLTACVLPDGRAAVIPGDETVCAELGLALRVD
ncbi:hypothetical protein [Arthrobacter sp. Br18]|uniref:hypothetical protein n=1 Tax=Arthrobacter sp. Br18 TaxID=1312954 RepID=UPI00047B7E0D|nr:hypothetical protein [Arthrobacter sp. Br18]